MKKATVLLFLLTISFLGAQESVNIALVNQYIPDNQLETQFIQSVKDELFQLLQHRYQLNVNEYTSPNQGMSEVFNRAYANNDIIICIGSTSSNYAISLGEYPKPTLASIILDAQLQGVEKTTEGSSGVENFSYMESPFNIQRDLNQLYEISPFDHLLVVTEQSTLPDGAFMEQLFSNYLRGKNVTVGNIFYENNIEEEINKLEGKRLAAYVFPFFGGDTTVIEGLFNTLNTNKVPSASLFDDPYLDAGVMMAYQTRSNLQKIPRRLALNAMKILEGQNTADLSVEMETFADNLILNLASSRQTGIYPTFDIMAQATVINLENIPNDNTLSLHEAIGLAIQNNLDIRIEQTDIQISETEVGVAKADMLPQVDFSTSFSYSDELSAFASQGAQGRGNWLATGEFSQVVLAEPVLANIAIQKMLMQGEVNELLQTQLDIILDVANAFINILFAKSNLNIQQQNVARIRENYDISKVKEAIGYVGATDINRWEAELANANIELNNAYASVRQAKFQLNQLLNRPISEPIKIENLTLDESLLLILDQRNDFLNDYGKLDLMADFMVQYALDNLPELAQIDIGMDVQKRLLLSRQRALYLPTMALSGSANRVLSKFDVPEGLPDINNVTTWNLGVGLSYPIFQGNSRRKLIEQSRLQVLQLEDTRKNAQNQLELRIRANLETVGASYPSMELSSTAATASRKNFAIIQNAYSEGQANITTLIDAQNNVLRTELIAINAVYTFILDFLTLERSIGFYNFLSTPEQRTDFFQKAVQYINKN